MWLLLIHLLLLFRAVTQRSGASQHKKAVAAPVPVSPRAKKAINAPKRKPKTPPQTSERSSRSGLGRSGGEKPAKCLRLDREPLSAAGSKPVVEPFELAVGVDVAMEEETELHSPRAGAEPRVHGRHTRAAAAALRERASADNDNPVPSASASAVVFAAMLDEKEDQRRALANLEAPEDEPVELSPALQTCHQILRALL